MKKRGPKWIFISVISIGLLVMLCVFFSKKLEGYHLMTNMREGSVSTFYITAQTTGTYTFECRSTFQNIAYDVYDVGSNELIENNSFGWHVEAYYPFMNMVLEEAHRYRVEMRVLDEDKLGTLVVKLKSIR